MGVANNYVSAVTVGVLTAGMTAAVAAVPPEQFATSRAAVTLTRTTIPITDVDQTFGPVHVIQQQTAYYDADTPGQFTAGIDEVNSVTWISKQVQAGAEYGTDQAVTLIGGAQGYGVAVHGALMSGKANLDLASLGSVGFGGSVGVYSAKLSAIPDEEIRVDLSFSPVNAALQLSRPGRPNKALSIDTPNELSIALKRDEISVTGAVGGEVTVGTKTRGRTIPIDVHIPTASAGGSFAAANRQGLANAQQAAPGEKVKTAVRAAKHRAQGRHAAAD
jgi:hypothetical protein